MKQFDGQPPPPLPLPPLSPQAFAAATNAAPDTLVRLQVYADLLQKWQKRINLVGRGTLDDVWRRHMLDSAQLLPLLAPTPSGRPPVVLDMGCGAGFPGLVLAIMGDSTVHLVESDSRKCAFLFEAMAQTGVKNVHLHNVRMETLAPFAVDIVTSRALASLDKLLDMAGPFLAPQTECLFLKGQKAQEELTQTLKTRTMDVVMIQSQTDPSGKILKLSTVQRTP